MQEQFLEVIDRDEAERRFRAALRLEPLGTETVPLGEALGRVLSRDIVSSIDVPSFDRSNFDGFAVQATDTYGAREEEPRQVRRLPETIATAVVPQCEITPGTGVVIATGGVLPRGADAVVMVEHAEAEGPVLWIRRAVTPGFGVTFAGTDMAAGETVLRRGDFLTSRETGVLAAIGMHAVPVWRRPRVGILSTGDEIIDPSQPMSLGKVYDSNARILADATRELGGEPVLLGIVGDDVEQLRGRVLAAIAECDVLLLSGGTSKGAGDISYRVLSDFTDPGVVVHGVALKPGKPICLAATRGKPVVILPGFPTSAIFTFHEFVAPVIRRLGGLSAEGRETVRARLAVKVNSEIGRTEYLLVGLLPAAHSSATRLDSEAPAAYPLGKGSGSVTTFSRADGFLTIARHEEIVPAGTLVDVQLLGRHPRTSDLVVIGSHCSGLDYLLSRLQDLGLRTQFLAAGSTAGLEAARREECDLAGIHLLDPRTGQYNLPYVDERLRWIPGYGRQQGLVFRQGDPRFAAEDPSAALAAAVADPRCRLVNRNQGSGTRLLIDQLLQGRTPPGYAVQPKNHNAVAAAVAQGRADWGVAIRSVAEQNGLGFLPLTWEQYDFVVPVARLQRPGVQAFQEVLREGATRDHLRSLGFSLT